jgi:hypothetical protein
MNKLTILSLYQRLTSPVNPFWADVRKVAIKIVSLVLMLIAAQKAGQIQINPTCLYWMVEVSKYAIAIGITAQATTTESPVINNPQLPAA